ncbi:hypothetical protein O3P69_014784 [Scylla paramamosain]|uniref:Uncharacterized protein n=1 Tax=Scylla paramamosain TaxID=85552 RepID=A0AAW0TZ70_SCYPA
MALVSSARQGVIPPRPGSGGGGGGERAGRYWRVKAAANSQQACSNHSEKSPKKTCAQCGIHSALLSHSKDSKRRRCMYESENYWRKAKQKFKVIDPGCSRALNETRKFVMPLLRNDGAVLPSNKDNLQCTASQTAQLCHRQTTRPQGRRISGMAATYYTSGLLHIEI